jgi:hypothetical protein
LRFGRNRENLPFNGTGGTTNIGVPERDEGFEGSVRRMS